MIKKQESEKNPETNSGTEKDLAWDPTPTSTLFTPIWGIGWMMGVNFQIYVTKGTVEWVFVLALVLFSVVAILNHVVTRRMFYRMKDLHAQYHQARTRFRMIWDAREERRLEMLRSYGFTDDMMEKEPAPSPEEFLRRHREGSDGDLGT